MAANTIESRKRLYVGSNQSLTMKMLVKQRVKAKVTFGVTSGRTPKVVVPTSPRDAEVSASVEMGQPRATRSARARQQRVRNDAHKEARKRTLDEDAVEACIQSPGVSGPVGVVQPALEGKEARDNLPELGDSAGQNEWAERQGADADDQHAELNDAVRLQICGHQLVSACSHGQGRWDVRFPGSQQCLLSRKTK